MVAVPTPAVEGCHLEGDVDHSPGIDGDRLGRNPVDVTVTLQHRNGKLRGDITSVLDLHCDLPNTSECLKVGSMSVHNAAFADTVHKENVGGIDPEGDESVVEVLVDEFQDEGFVVWVGGVVDFAKVVDHVETRLALISKLLQEV